MMKNPLLFLLVFLPFISLAQDPSDTVAFADANFKYTLLNQDIFVRPPIDTNQDGEIQYSEAAAVDTLIVGDPQASFNIQDLTGIEAFVNLTYLDCQNNQLTSLDLSQNISLQDLNCEGNQLNSLNISQNTQLKALGCNNNQLTTLDLTQNTELKGLSCSHNQLTLLDLSQNLQLTGLACTNNQLSSLNLSQNTQLTGLGCTDNQLTSLDIRNGNNTNFTFFYAENNPDLTCIFVDDRSYSQNNADWHKDTSAHYVETQSECEAFGVNDYDLQRLKIYPNPVKHKLYIQSGSKFQSRSFGTNFKFQIFNLRGQKLFSDNFIPQKEPLDFSSFPSGIYFLKITSRNHTLTRKIIKL